MQKLGVAFKTRTVQKALSGWRLSFQQNAQVGGSFWMSEQDPKKPEEEGSGRKLPSGFEKLLKRTKRGSSSTTSKSDDKEKKDIKRDDENLSEQEEDAKQTGTDSGKNSKQDQKESKHDSGRSNFGKNLYFQFFEPNGGGPKWEGWLMLSLISATTVYYFSSIKQTSKEISYQDFIQNHLAKNDIQMITLCEDKTGSTFKFKANLQTVQGEQFHLVLPQVENFLYKLDLAQREMGKDPSSFVPVKYGQAESQENPVLNVMIGASCVMMALLLYRSLHGKGGSNSNVKPPKGSDEGGFGSGGMGGLMNMSKSNAQIFGVDKKIKTRFRHVAGMTNAKQEVVEFVDFLKNPEKYKKLGAKIPRGALLVGPPGTGKTLLAKAVAGEAGVPFLSISGSDFVQMYVGVGASRVRDLFKQAKSMSPSIIFIDEIDAVAKKRDQKFSSNDERDNTLNQLLVEMDGFATDEAVIILAATNLADSLDPAIKRPGRFDRTIEITLPTIDERREIYNVHLKKIKVNEERTRDEYASKMSALTPGFSGADIANICNEGAIIAARNNLENVSLQQFEQATERVLAGIEKKSIMTPAERKTVAYHEAGHAVTGWFLEHANPLLKITIIPRSKGSLGFAQYLPEEISLYTKEALIDMIKVALGGRVCEQIFFKKVTTGASDDIKKVTQIATGLVQIYGMSSEFGLVSFQSQEGGKPFSEYTAIKIDNEVRKIVDQCYAEVVQLLEEKRNLIEALAEVLLEKESINLPQIIKVLGDRPYPMKESLKDYLKEMETRDEKAAAEKKAQEMVVPEIQCQSSEQENKEKVEVQNQDKK